MTQRILVGDVKNDGRFKPGERRSPATEFKPGEHWRPRKPYWDREWLEAEYVKRGRSAGDIAAEFGATDAAIIFWLRKHNIPRRTVAEARALKHWGASGEANGMYGKRGPEVPNWQGGVTPERQAFYSSGEWKRAARRVRERDKGICQRCGRDNSGSRDNHLHHITSFSVVERRADPSNLVTLCRPCHNFVHSRGNVNREFMAEGKEVGTDG